MFPVEPYVLAILAASTKLVLVAEPPLEPLALGDILEKRVDFMAPAVVKPNCRGCSVVTF